MKLYFAPLVGVTGYVYRNAHFHHAIGVDKYFTPFISPTKEGLHKCRERMDIVPEQNKQIPLIPQILTNKAEEFICTAKQLKEMGYEEINLNLGCPSGPIVSKGRGAGFLAKTEELKRFLDEIYARSEVAISIKTRLGKDNPEEFYKLLELYNEYPVHELIIHARVQQDFYNNRPNHAMFSYAQKNSKCPVCYNGDIFTVSDYKTLTKQCRETDRIMLGRGLLANPSLAAELKQLSNVNHVTNQIKAIHGELFCEYKKVLSGDSFVLTRMKQFWFYVHQKAECGEIIWEQVKNLTCLSDYVTLMNEYQYNISSPTINRMEQT